MAATAAVGLEVRSTRPMMGGAVTVAMRDDSVPMAGERAAAAILARIGAWAGRLTRFDRASELSRLNDAPGPAVWVGPTLAAVLDWARIAEGLTDGLVDVAMLDERLAAERGDPDLDPLVSVRAESARRRWSMTRRARGAIVHRDPGVRFDLDGIAKGWLADRALELVPGASAMVDGDGDVAVRLGAGGEWAFGVADPRDADGRLAVLRLRAPADRAETWGIATSGTSVHRWTHGFGATHHLIDPRTRRPAITDVVQATVVAATARAAEAFAKVAVVAGSQDAFERLDRPEVRGLLLLTDDGTVLASREMTRWLA